MRYLILVLISIGNRPISIFFPSSNFFESGSKQHYFEWDRIENAPYYTVQIALKYFKVIVNAMHMIKMADLHTTKTSLTLYTKFPPFSWWVYTAVRSRKYKFARSRFF